MMVPVTKPFDHIAQNPGNKLDLEANLEMDRYF